MDIDRIILQLRSVGTMLIMIDTDELEKHVIYHRRHIEHWTGIGPLLDPTQYRDAIKSGKQQDAILQLEIVEALLKARQAIDKRETYARASTKKI